MRVCARCAPPRGPDVALLLLVVVVALVVVLETAAAINPCPLARLHHHQLHGRSKRTTLGSSSGASSPSPSTEDDASLTTSALSGPDGSDPLLEPPSGPPSAPEVSSVWVSPQATSSAPTSASTAPVDVDDILRTSVSTEDLTESQERVAQLLAASTSLPTPGRRGDGGEPSLPDDVAVALEDDHQSLTTAVGEDDVSATPIIRKTPPPPPPKRGPSTTTSTSSKSSAATARAAKLQEERARRLEKIQRDVLERKHKRARTSSSPPVTAATTALDGGLDLDEDKRRQAGGDRRRPPVNKQEESDKRERARGRADRQDQKRNRDRASPAEEHDDGPRQRGQEDKSAKSNKRPGGRQRARHQDADEDADLHRDRSVEDNSVSDESWEDSSAPDDVSGEWSGLVCPTTQEVSLLSRQCSSDRDCKLVGEQCCKDRWGLRRCVVGVAPTLPDIPHEPFFGVISRVCPSATDTIVEPWSITNCTTDDDCWPRVCCVAGPNAYCRTPQLEWEKLPGQRFVAPLRLLMSYLQCTPAPPPVFDLFPKPCRNTIDCFPNLCCQEKGRKVCRPPKRSLLALLASLGQGAGYSFMSQVAPRSRKPR